MYNGLRHIMELCEILIFDDGFTEIFNRLDVNFKDELILIRGVVQFINALVNLCIRVCSDLSQWDDFPEILCLLPS